MAFQRERECVCVCVCVHTASWRRLRDCRLYSDHCTKSIRTTRLMCFHPPLLPASTAELRSKPTYRWVLMVCKHQTNISTKVLGFRFSFDKTSHTVNLLADPILWDLTTPISPRYFWGRGTFQGVLFKLICKKKYITIVTVQEITEWLNPLHHWRLSSDPERDTPAPTGTITLYVESFHLSSFIYSVCCFK